jgi:hypothetical protein
MQRYGLDSFATVQTEAKMIKTAADNKPNGITAALVGRDDWDGQASPTTLP